MLMMDFFMLNMEFFILHMENCMCGVGFLGVWSGKC